MIQNEVKIKLPRLISDDMVMQRNASIKIWGWAPAGAVLTVHFIQKVYRATANINGEWQVIVQTGDAGGPYDMIIVSEKDAERIIIKNILLGDVWICSGQSNMEMRMDSVKDFYSDEIIRANNDSIRQFLVPQEYDFESPRNDFNSGCWAGLNPQNILNFTAVGYFFAMELFEKYQIPIGLINASLGGSPAEAWLSQDALSLFPEYLESAKRFSDKNYLNDILKQNQVNWEEWYNEINRSDIGISEGEKTFFDPNYNASAWPCIKIPSYWSEEGLGDFNGVVWFRKEIEVPANFLSNPVKLFLGNIVDEDTVYINGTKIGTTPMQYIPRQYDIPKGVLKEGRNTIIVRVVNLSGKGGFYKGKPYHLTTGDETIDLYGDWQYRVGVKSAPMPEPVFVQWHPSGLYNGMIAPMISYRIKGVIWYQGESNTKKPEEYENLFKTLIADWRKKWNIVDLPFLYVQLPNYMEALDQPTSSSWAALREAQRKVLAVPGTGMAVAIDLGEWNDIHPRNKKDVGKRLALVAQKVAYGDKTVVASGPMFKYGKRDGKRIILSFDNVGGGLITKDGAKLRHFAIAEDDKVFVWADAEIQGDCVVIWKDDIPNPIYVRYGWADNPEGANLYNREGLPASPFIADVDTFN